jgi:hypothetical protein
VSEQHGEADADRGARAGAEAPDSGETPRPVQVRIRRAPRYRSFVVAGAVLGVIVAVVTTTVLGDGDPRFSPSTVTGYLAAIGLLIGGLLGATVAVLVDRPRRSPR